MIAEVNSKEGDPSDIFEKVDYVRNLKAINNRMELFNYSKGQQQNKKYQKGVTANIYLKIREVFKRDASIKCKIGSQILIK